MSKLMTATASRFGTVSSSLAKKRPAAGWIWSTLK